MTEELFELLINNNLDGMFAFDLECRYTIWNPAMQRFFGVNKAEVLGKSAVEVFPFLKQSGEDEFYGRALTGETIIAEYRPYPIPQTDQTGFYEASYAPLYNKSGEIIGGLGTVRDVTKHRQAEVAEQEQRRWLETMRQVTQDLTLLRDLDTLLYQIVERALQLFGGDGGGIYLYRAEPQVLEWSVAVGELEKPIGLTFGRGEGVSGKVWETGQPLIVDDYQSWSGRSLQWVGAPVSVVGVPIQWGDEFMGVLALRVLNTLRCFTPEDLPLISQFASQAAIAIHNARLYEQAQQEIAERKRVEQALRQSEAKNQAIFSAIPDLLLRTHRDGTSLELIPGVEIKPYQPYDQLLGKNVYEILPEAVARERMHYVEQALQTGQVEVYEFQLPVAGKLGDFEARVVASGEDEALVIIRDVSQRKRAEKALAEERNLLRTLIDNLPDYIYFKDVTYRFVIANVAVAQIMGVESPDELVGKSDFNFHPPELAEHYYASEQSVIQSGQPVIDLEEPLIDPAGNQRWILTSQVPLRDNQGQIIGLVGVGRDITERKKVEAELQAYRERLEALVRERTVELEQAMTEIAAARDRINAILHSVADGLLVTDINHRIILANSAAANLLELPLDKILDQKIGAGVKNDQLQEIVHQTLTHQSDGVEIDIQLGGSNHPRGRVIRARTALVDDHHGQPLGTVTIIQDVTRLREVDRLKTELLTTVAHELRTPLTSILGFSEILLNRQLDVARQHRYLKFINQQSTHLAEVIQDLLDISRLESGRGLDLKLDLIDMAKLIEEVVAPFIEIATTHEIQIEGFMGLPLLVGDRFRLVQVGRNLLSNAIKYSVVGDKIIIRGRLYADCFEISFQDEGIGMSPEQQKYLFEPFYRADTSHTAIGGTGLGLAISRLIVEQHGGQIWLHSELGKGTTVYFKLPLTQEGNAV